METIDNANRGLLVDYAEYVETKIEYSEVPLTFEQWQDCNIAAHDPNVPYERKIYLLVAITLKSKEQITENISDQFSTEVEYNFISRTKEVKIKDTDIAEVYDQHPDNL